MRAVARGILLFMTETNGSDKNIPVGEAVIAKEEPKQGWLWKAADLYLGLVAFSYALLGLGFVVGKIPVLGYLAVPSLPILAIGLFLGMIPGRVILLSISIDSAAPYPWLPMVLGALALIFGVLALIALMKIKKYPEFIRFWYFLAILSWLIFLDNVIVIMGNKGLVLGILPMLTHPVLITLSLLKIRPKKTV